MIILLLIFGVLFQTDDWIITNQDGNTYNADDSFHLYDTLVEIGETIDEAIETLDERADWRNPYTHEFRRRVTVVYPSMGLCPNACYFWHSLADFLYDGTVHLPDGFSRRSLLHEYGHFIYVVMCDWDYGNIPTHDRYDSHWYSKQTDKGFALIEGWAEFFPCWVDDSAFNMATSSMTIETNQWAGDDVEGSVASVLWDLTDTVDSLDNSVGIDDESVGDLSRRLWRVVEYQHPQNISEIRNQFYTRQTFRWADLKNKSAKGIHGTIRQ